MADQQSIPSKVPFTKITINKANIFRMMYFINLLGAGIPGFLLVFFPTFAESYVLWEGQDYATMTLLGSIWLSIGIASIMGMIRPFKFLGIFLVQFLYKSIWLLVFVGPFIMLGGQLNPAMKIIIGIFIFLVVEFALFVRPKDFTHQSHA